MSRCGLVVDRLREGSPPNWTDGAPVVEVGDGPARGGPAGGGDSVGAATDQKDGEIAFGGGAATASTLKGRLTKEGNTYKHVLEYARTRWWQTWEHPGRAKQPAPKGTVAIPRGTSPRLKVVLAGLPVLVKELF